MTITEIIMAGFGGCAGAICRFLVYEMVSKSNLFFNMEFPIATFLVNILGSFIIGFLAGITECYDIFLPHIRLFLFVGFLGGFTTFSTFGYELFSMIKSEAIMNACLYAGMHIIFGVLAVASGFYLSLRIPPVFFH